MTAAVRWKARRQGRCGCWWQGWRHQGVLASLSPSRMDARCGRYSLGGEGRVGRAGRRRAGPSRPPRRCLAVATPAATTAAGRRARPTRRCCPRWREPPPGLARPAAIHHTSTALPSPPQLCGVPPSLVICRCGRCGQGKGGGGRPAAAGRCASGRGGRRRGAPVAAAAAATGANDAAAAAAAGAAATSAVGTSAVGGSDRVPRLSRRVRRGRRGRPLPRRYTVSGGRRTGHPSVASSLCPDANGVHDHWGRLWLWRQPGDFRLPELLVGSFCDETLQHTVARW